MHLLHEIQTKTQELSIILALNNFRLRYINGTIQINEHYQFLCQVLQIYQLLEEKMLSPDFYPKLPLALHFLNEHSKSIEKDLTFITRNFEVGTASQTTTANLEYLRLLRALNAPEDNNQIFAHFLIRTYRGLSEAGEMFGAMNALYARLPSLSAEPLKEQGKAYFTYPKGSMQGFIQWVNALGYTPEDNLVIYVNHALQREIFLLDELDEKFTPYSLTQNVANFFQQAASFVDAVFDHDKSMQKRA